MYGWVITLATIDYMCFVQDHYYNGGDVLRCVIGSGNYIIEHNPCWNWDRYHYKIADEVKSSHPLSNIMKAWDQDKPIYLTERNIDTVLPSSAVELKRYSKDIEWNCEKYRYSLN